MRAEGRVKQEGLIQGEEMTCVKPVVETLITCHVLRIKL